MSDCGAISSPTVITSPMQPLLAKESRAGVEAACSGVNPSNLGLGRSLTPSSRTYTILLLSADTRTQTLPSNLFLWMLKGAKLDILGSIKSRAEPFEHGPENPASDCHRMLPMKTIRSSCIFHSCVSLPQKNRRPVIVRVAVLVHVLRQKKPITG